MKTKYTVDYFINKFEAIPEFEYNVGELRNDYNSDQKCALGHCNATNNKLGIEASMLNKLFDVLHISEKPSCEKLWNFELTNRDGDFLSGKVACINDGECNEYLQETPKQRILAALYDIKALQQPKIEEVKEEKVVYKVVEVDKKVKQLVNQDLILS